MTVPQRSVGSQGLVASAQGLGCMGMSEFYGETDEAESIATIHRALDLGVNFLDTADVYGMGANESLVGPAIRSRRDDVVVATKFGIVRDPENPMSRGISGKPDYVRACCDASLRRLGLDHVDLYYQHRVDPTLPIEETVGAMAELVAAGKVRYLGLSESGPETLRRAHATHPISALQSEWSLWSRDLEPAVLPVARELGIGIVAYSPLGRGFLSGEITSPDDFGPTDFRRFQPRFQGDNFSRNLELVERLTAMAKDRGATAAQLALAWVHAKGDDVFPIPGTKRRKWLDQNVAALDLQLSGAEMAELDVVLAPDAVAGDRYEDMRWVQIESA